MAQQDAQYLQTFYSGDPAMKLATARTLFAECAAVLPLMPHFIEQLAQLRQDVEVLDAHMQAMQLGQLCTGCAARPGGGCCSAYMAGNSDVLQIALNLFLGSIVEYQPDEEDRCGFLGQHGCCFLVKPIFCLNYNCSHILASAKPEELHRLYQRVAAVLSQQTEMEGLLLDLIRKQSQRDGGFSCTPP
jgi:hypothetical protein